jgi:hypothetical protein
MTQEDAEDRVATLVTHLRASGNIVTDHRPDRTECSPKPGCRSNKKTSDRDIQPQFVKIGLAWADFRAPQRTNSTLMRAAGADARVSADSRGHGPGVAMEEYTHSTPDQKRDAAQKLEAIVN